VLWVNTVTGFVVAVGRIGVGVGGWEVSHSKVRPKSLTPMMSVSFETLSYACRFSGIRSSAKGR
jgi:hypothetical protein